ncbi:protein FAM149A isoform X2 [Hemitrygon akajei]|uniref:protein FAM149A isoform X2 n=1 Tax=Hemitrygon akajei TaxID=2704970 RepID=UPI003BF9C22A
MKVAVLDLGTIFAKIFTTSASPVVPPVGSSSSGSPASPRGPPVSVSSSKTTPFISSLFNVSGKSSVLSGTAPGPECSAALKVCSASPLPSAGLSTGAPARPTPSCSPVGPGAARTAQAHGEAAGVVMGSAARSPVHVAENVGWNPPIKQYPFALPDIGEEWWTDTEPVESNNEKKGLLKGTNYLPGKAIDSLPTNFTKHVQGAIHSYNSGDSIVSESSIGQTTPTDLNNSWSGIQSDTTSECSSVYSWRDDEFDKANTQTVHQLFWEIDEMLFEGKVSCRTESIQTECREWVERSPQLRILGTQLLQQDDEEGIQRFQSRGKSSMATRALPSFCESTSDMKELSLLGVRLLPTHSPFHSSNFTISSLDSECSIFSFLEEEIYDTDGSIEEYFAFDSKECISEDESLKQKKVQVAQRRNKRGIPPISPHACLQDAVSAEIFNDIWRDVIDVLEELIRKNWENNLSGEAKQTASMQSAIMSKMPHINDSRINLNYSVPPSRGSETRFLALGSSSFHSQAHRMANTYRNDLNGVMTIQAKPLQQRHTGLPEKAQCDQDEKQLSTGSSILSTTRNRMGRTTEHSVLSASRIIQASSRKTVTQRKLPSLSSELLKLKASNVNSDEILRGTKFTNASTTCKSSQYVEAIAKVHSGARHQIYQHFTLKRHTGLDQLTSPSQATRHNQLPPINSESAEMHLPLPGSVPQLRGRFLHSRVSSAVGEGTGRRPLRERLFALDTSSRPNTTHTFRSDTPFKRSFTPMDYGSQARLGRASFTGPQVHLQSKTFNRFPANSKKRSQVVQ